VAGDSGEGMVTGLPGEIRAGDRIVVDDRPRVVLGGSGTLVRFAGRRAITGRRGRATIVATLHRTGMWRAVATKPGFVAARTTVRVNAR